jgi:hypothetical protein
VISTRHQLINLHVEEGDVENLGILLLKDNKLITNAGFFRYGTIQQFNSDDRYDIIALFFDEQFSKYRELYDRFIDLGSIWDVKTDEIITAFAAGCAFADQIVDTWENHRLHVVRRNHECRYLEQKSTGIRSVADATQDLFDPNGMSGGAIFYVRKSIDFARIEFGGMIQRGGNSIYHYIDARQISLFLDAAIESHFGRRSGAG